MRKLQVLVLALIFPVLAGCATIDKIREAAGAATTQFTNPVGREELYNLEVTLRAARAVAVIYRDYCYSKPLAQLPQVVCSRRREVVEALKRYDDNAASAVVSARNFIEQNPTISAVGLVSAAKQAILDYKNAADSFAGDPR